MKPMIIHWTDTTGQGDQQTWLSSGEVAEMQPCEMVTVGYLLVDDEDYIVVAATRSTDPEDDAFGNVNAIPKCCITSVDSLCCEKPESCETKCEVYAEGAD